MEVYLDDNILDDLSKEDNIKALLEKVYSKLEDEIIDEIYLNDVEVNEEYLLNNDYDLEQISTLKFKTQPVDELIKNTIQEIKNYLPKLKQGVKDTAILFREGDFAKANSKFKLCIEGMQWYINVQKSILNLLENEELQEKGTKRLNDFNKILNNVLNSFQQDDIVFVADLLEYEIIDFIDEFIEFNDELRE